MGAWASAKACESNTSLFSALARDAERRMADFNAQDVAITAWALAMAGAPDRVNTARVFAGRSDVQLFQALKHASEQHVGNFSEQGLLLTCWAFSRRESLQAAWSLFDHVMEVPCTEVSPR